MNLFPTLSARTRQRFGNAALAVAMMIVIAIRRKSGEMIFQPSGETKILEGDMLIVIGKAESVAKLVRANK